MGFRLAAFMGSLLVYAANCYFAAVNVFIADDQAKLKLFLFGAMCQ
jgi:hypothetical protein